MSGSILSQLLKGQITFSQAATEAASWFSVIVSRADPSTQAAVTQAAGAALSDVKQAASNAVDFAEGALGPVLSVAVDAVEAATEALLTHAVGPTTSGQLTPIVDNGIDQLVAMLTAAAQAKGAQIKAALAAPVATQQQGA